MKSLLCACCAALLLALSPAAQADWFVSAETKALITQAEGGDAQAQLRVGAAYDRGQGAPRDADAAIKWYRKAAEQGLAEAQNSLGSLLQAGKRYEDARPWFEKAAAQGHAQATNNLAYLFDLGLGVPQDRRQGLLLYTRAADLGWAEAMWNIANLYGSGQLGEKDLVAACTWSLRARRHAEPHERQLQAHLDRVLPALERSLTSGQYARCNEQADSWKPATPAN